MEEILTLRVRCRPGYVLVTAAGEIDISTVPRLRRVLRAVTAGGRRVDVDLDQVSFIDATGLGALAGAAGRAAAAGGSLQVTAAPPRIRRLLAITGLDRHLLTVGAGTETVGDRGPALPRPEPSRPRVPAAPARPGPDAAPR
jgi:anti-sigma B factor antagonist